MSRRGRNNNLVWWIVGGVIALFLFFWILRGCTPIDWRGHRLPPVIEEPVPTPQIPPAAQEPPQDTNLIDPDADGKREIGEIEVPSPEAAREMEIGDEGVALGPQPFAAGQQFPTIKGSRATMINSVIAYGNTYMGRPYVFGSNRNNDKDFDCSDFVQWIYKQKTGLKLPLDSRAQRAYVQSYGNHRWNSIAKAEPGDLLFFMSYKGTAKSAYPSTVAARKEQTTTHVGLYLGNGRMLHTASAASGGVRIDYILGKHWEHRYQYSGGVLLKTNY